MHRLNFWDLWSSVGFYFLLKIYFSLTTSISQSNFVLYTAKEVSNPDSERRLRKTSAPKKEKARRSKHAYNRVYMPKNYRDVEPLFLISFDPCPRGTLLLLRPCNWISATTDTFSSWTYEKPKGRLNTSESISFFSLSSRKACGFNWIKRLNVCHVPYV